MSSEQWFQLLFLDLVNNISQVCLCWCWSGSYWHWNKKEKRRNESKRSSESGSWRAWRFGSYHCWSFPGYCEWKSIIEATNVAGMTFSMMDAFSAHFLLYSYAVFCSRKCYLKLVYSKKFWADIINMYFPVFATSLYMILFFLVFWAFALINKKAQYDPHH